MEEYILPENFFEENELMELSAAQLTYFFMVNIRNKKFNEFAEKSILPYMEEGKRRNLELEKESVAEIKSAAEVIAWMRKIKEGQNRLVLLEKALSVQTEVIPLILKRLMTSGHDSFIENAATVLAYSDMKYVEQVYEVFEKIRSPYARAAISIVFGFRERKDYIPLLHKQYLLLKKEYPEKNYDQGPLLALDVLY